MEDAKLTPQVRDLARDTDAVCWGSLDVPREDVLARMRVLTLEELAQLGSVLEERFEASRERQRNCERTVEVLEQRIELLESQR